MSAQFTFEHFFSVLYSIHVWESYSLLWTVICIFKREIGRFRNLLIDVFCTLFESTVYKENLSLFYTCVKRLSATRTGHTQFENKIAALKSAFEGFGCAFVRLLLGNGYIDFDSTFFNFCIHAWEGWKAFLNCQTSLFKFGLVVEQSNLIILYHSRGSVFYVLK